MTSYQVNTENGSSNLELSQDLIMEKGSGRKKNLIFVLLGLGAIVVVGATVILLVVFLQPGFNSTSNKNTSAITLEEILYGNLAPDGFNATWVSDSELLFRDTDGNILLHDMKTSISNILLPGNNSVLSAVSEYTLSPDRKFLLVRRDFQKLYRYSYLAQYTVINLASQRAITVNVSGENLLQLAIWGPVGNTLIFIMRNNIYHRAGAENTENTAITEDGSVGHIYNGVPDWVYEEEIFSSNKAFWFSPDGEKLAYVKFNDTAVPVMTIPVYGQSGDLNFQYTRALQIRYPKAGTINPTVTLHVVDLSNSFFEVTLAPPEALRSGDYILATVSWASSTTLIAVWMNRVQNYAEIVAYKVLNRIVDVDKVVAINETKGWIELFSPPEFSKDGSKMALIYSQDQGDNLGTYRHITLFHLQDNLTSEAVTSGTYVVGDILSWDSNTNLIYFTANTEDDPAVQHLYSVSTITKEKTCLSCEVKHTLFSTNCLYNSADFSMNHSFFALKCNGPGIPQVTIRTNKKHTTKKVTEWSNNDELYLKLQMKSLPSIKRMTFEVADGFRAQVLLKLPPNMDASGKTKYPMVVNVYGGPDSYQVVERYSIDWGSYLASNKSYIYAVIDGRGSGLKGDKMLFSIYRALGTVEVSDQINVTRQIQKSLPYIDANRTAIWGWSYGGYASAMVLARDTEKIFKCGMSVAPVTDWTLYDSVYTERFMGLPTTNDNYEGYKNAELLAKYEGIRNKQYFLIHGTLDDNVHYQQSMFWAKVLEHQDILFRQLSYPDEDHGLASVLPHLYHSMENFLNGCFSSKL